MYIEVRIVEKEPDEESSSENESEASEESESAGMSNRECFMDIAATGIGIHRCRQIERCHVRRGVRLVESES